MTWYLHITYAHPPVNFTSSLDYLQYLMQCKCYVCSYQHMANSSLAFWSSPEFFPLIFLILVSWIWECGTHGYTDVLMFLLGTSWSRGREFPASSHYWALERSALRWPQASWLGAQTMCWIRFGQVWCFISRLSSSVRDQSFLSS